MTEAAVEVPPFYEDESVTVFLGACQDALKNLPDNSVHAVICDPPYGMSTEPKMDEVLKHWLAGDDYVHKGGGFMGKSWDSFVPGPSIWREIFRVLKPGGMLAAFASTRTADLMGIAIRLAGFERRDTILHIGSEVVVIDEMELAWVYGSGFPKEGDLGIAVDRYLGHEPKAVTRVETTADNLMEEGRVEEVAATRTSGIGAAYNAAADEEAWQSGAGQQLVQELEPVSEEGKRWRGWSSTLKPANEPIILARKPLSEKNIPANVLMHDVGAYNIAGAAIGNAPRVNPPSGTLADTEAQVPKRKDGAVASARDGRWPPNVVVSHAEGCRKVGESKQKANGEVGLGPSARPHQGMSGSGSREAVGVLRIAHVSADGMETVETWACVEGCQVREMDMQGAGDAPWRAVRTPDGDQGFTQGVSRFMYCPKPTRKEKDAGITSDAEYVANRAGGSGIAMDEAIRAGQEPAGSKVKNTHLTVKPIDLMRWLVKLLTPPGGTVLDPFMGSGTTGCAAMLEEMRFVGCEMTPEHAAQATQRILYWKKRAELEGGTQEALF